MTFEHDNSLYDTSLIDLSASDSGYRLVQSMADVTSLSDINAQANDVNSEMFRTYFLTPVQLRDKLSHATLFIKFWTGYMCIVWLHSWPLAKRMRDRSHQTTSMKGTGLSEVMLQSSSAGVSVYESLGFDVTEQVKLSSLNTDNK
jgi:hypothetical protein